MNHTLFLSAVDYDVHTIRKVATINSQLGEIRIHDAEGGYLLTFGGCQNMNAEQTANEFQRYLIDLTHNIWSH